MFVRTGAEGINKRLHDYDKRLELLGRYGDSLAAARSALDTVNRRYAADAPAASRGGIE